MARKGTHKVRTGCLTCKGRKVKCDEAKPACARCVRAGRRCDGYGQPQLQARAGVEAAASAAAQDPGQAEWFARPRRLLAHAVDPAEARALQYYCQAAGPVLSGPIDPDFWGRLVYQFSAFEPAVRHSVVAISSLYEKLGQNPRGPMAVLDDSSLALGHYNAAIGQLRRSDNQPLIVLACLLFITIEVLQDNTPVAIQHCRHGILLLNTIADRYAWLREFLVPIFRRMTLLPLFFGTFPDDFPVPVPVSARDGSMPSRLTAFESLAEARDHMWDCMIHSMQLVRMSEPYRQLDHNDIETAVGATAAVPPDLVSAQLASHAQLDRWHTAWQGLMSQHPHTGDGDALTRRPLTRVNIAIRYAVCRIWTATALDPTETCYDAYAGVFRQCVDQASSFRHTLPAEWHAAKRGIKFMLEMGYAPMLYFVALKCRDLPVRLRALQLMLLLGSPRENLWDVAAMYARGLRVVEAEHGVALDRELDPSPMKEAPAVLTPAVWPGLPPEDWRVRGMWTDYKAREIVQLKTAVARGAAGSGVLGSRGVVVGPGSPATSSSSIAASHAGGSISSSCCTSPASLPSPPAATGGGGDDGRWGAEPRVVVVGQSKLSTPTTPDM
ncbi:RNA polymerase II-specific transcription factor-like protein [Microdochium nivale]|nr:RNA polymerase II-specific transcription factor-like protein [Microdochium nivale]